MLDLNDDELFQKIIDTNDVQNALIELLRFVDDVINLQVITKPSVQVNDTVYVITEYYYGEKEVIECKITRLTYKNKFTFSVKGEYANGNFYNANFTEKSIGKNVFLSKEEAEKHMK